MLKVNNINIRKRGEIYSKLTIKTPEGTYFKHFFSVSFVDIEHGNACLVPDKLHELKLI